MKKLLGLMLLLFGFYQPQVFSASLETSALKTSTAIGNETLNLGTLETGRPSQINLWFPQGHCANLPEKIFCLADSAITDKAIILSHGAMGSVQEYSWLAQALAEAGYVVVGVNHFGESWSYGAETQSVRNTNLIWQRPQDISAILDRLSAREIFQRKINWNHIIAVGHSSGGQTVSMLAGAQFDLKRLMAYCSSDNSKQDKSCQYASNTANVPEAFLKKFSESQTDTRIQTLVMLDPALGAAAIPESLQKVHLPTLIVGIEKGDFLTWEYQGRVYATQIPKATLETFTGDEGHFIFLNSCDHSVKVMGVSLCEDKPGVDRKLAHQFILSKIKSFLSADQPINHSQNAYHKTSNIPLSVAILFEILSYTPAWVFGLLAGLILFGLLQTRTRHVRISVALLLPFAMLILSLSGVINYAGFNFINLICWIAAILLVAAIVFKLSDKKFVKYIPDNGKLLIQGSWMPLMVILGIFFTRYTLGVAIAMDLHWIHSAFFAPCVSLVLGAWGSYFFARGVIFWRARTTKN